MEDSRCYSFLTLSLPFLCHGLFFVRFGIELTTGPELGRGEFGIVLEISSIHLLEKKEVTFSMAQSLSEMSLGSLGGGGGGEVNNSNNNNNHNEAPPPSVVIVENHTHIPSNARDNTVDLNVSTALTHHRRNTSVTFADDNTIYNNNNNNIEDSKTAEQNEGNSSRHPSVSTDDTAPVDNTDNRSDEYEDDILSFDENEDKEGESLNSSGHNNQEKIIVNDPDAQQHMARMRERFAKKAIRQGETRFALKKVRQDVHDKTIKLDAVLDLACEARYLQSISHSNIIRLRGIQGDPGTPSFGLVLDRLVTTLDKKVEEWRKGYHGRHGGINKLTSVFRRKQNKELDKILYADRLLVALDVARAMRHLHRKKILYRDIKPENIGFNVRGYVQIFDFGLAKELHSKDLVEDDDGYEATGLTGSRRFMAPEVVRCLPYGFSADVFSFAILFWYIFALKTPFATYDANRHYEKVVEGKQRPHRLRVLSSMLHRMMEDAWNDDRRKRPQFKQICQMIQSEVVNINGLLHNSRSDDSVMNRTSHLLDRSLRSLSNISDVFNPEPSTTTT